jgi:carbamoyltransferase
LKKILGISAYYHDSAATLTIGGNVISAAQEERFTRKKHDSSFPINAITFCLNYSNLKLSDLDAIVFYDKPMLRFERFYNTFMHYAPKGFTLFAKFILDWVNGYGYPPKMIRKELCKIGQFDKKKLLFTEHHLAHAASAFYPSNFKRAAILTLDGVGERSSISIGVGNGLEIRLLKEMNYPHSIGFLYSSFTYFLGFKVNSGEYKMMGLAPFGNEQDDETLHFIDLIKNNLVDIKEDGSIFLNQHYFNYSLGDEMIKVHLWESLFKTAKRKPENVLNQHHCNLAFAIQKVTEEIILKLVNETKKLTGEDNLCMAGGVAFNCVANGKINQSKIFKNLFIQPASDDSGGALGAALAISHMYFNENRDYSLRQTSFLGPQYNATDVEQMAINQKATYKKYPFFEALILFIANQLAEGKVVAWFQDKMEFGARALGNRSILADTRDPQMQKKLNLKIKFREDFRPFAPSVLVEDKNVYFDLKGESPFMMLVAPVKQTYLLERPLDFNQLDYMEKLYVKRSHLPAITHVDNSARIQTVSASDNSKYYQLLKAFKSVTGYGLLANTSFNVRGEPIVCSPKDAYGCFMKTDLDILVINEYVFIKADQTILNR